MNALTQDYCAEHDHPQPQAVQEEQAEYDSDAESGNRSEADDEKHQQSTTENNQDVQRQIYEVWRCVNSYLSSTGTRVMDLFRYLVS